MIEVVLETVIEVAAGPVGKLAFLGFGIWGVRKIVVKLTEEPPKYSGVADLEESTYPPAHSPPPRSPMTVLQPQPHELPSPFTPLHGAQQKATRVQPAKPASFSDKLAEKHKLQK